MRIRRMELGDLPGVIALQAACYPRSMCEAQALLEHRLEVASPTAWVAEERDKKRSEANGPLCGYPMCGYLFAYRSQLGKVTALGGFFEPEPEGDCLYLHDLAISPRFMGRRVAIRLVQHAWARAWDTGLRASALVAVQGSAPFWSRLGYTSQPALAAEQAARLETYEGEAHYLVKHFA